MTKSPRKNVPDVGIELGAACMPSEHAFDRATAPGQVSLEYLLFTKTGISQYAKYSNIFISSAKTYTCVSVLKELGMVGRS